MSERVQTCFLRRSRQNEILEVWKHSICTSHSSLIAVLTAQDSDFMYTNRVSCVQVQRKVQWQLQTAVQDCVSTSVSTKPPQWPEASDETFGPFAATSVVTIQESLKRRRDNFQLCWCKQNLITSGCFPAVSLDVFDRTTGHFLMFFLFFWRMFLTRNCHVSRPC